MTKKYTGERNMFILSGWLFADMFLAMTMIFLASASIGKYVPSTPKAPSITGLDKPIYVNFTIDMNELTSNPNPDINAPAIIQLVEQQVHNQLKGYLHTHPEGKAAIVNTFGGGIDDQTDTDEANHINAILRQMGYQQHYVFD